jgi:hypothetical protein
MKSTFQMEPMIRTNMNIHRKIDRLISDVLTHSDGGLFY